MARAEAASASARPDSIKGLAQSIAKPAYRRLLTAEPALRRAVPALIIAFLLTIGVGSVVQVLDHRRQAIADAIHDILDIADFAAERFNRLAGTDSAESARREILERALAARATMFGRVILLSNSDGIVTAAIPPVGAPIGQKLNDVLGDVPALTILGASAGVVEIPLAGGNRAFATVRTLAPGRGQLAVVQSRADALARWRADTTLTVTLSATTGFVLLILGFAFHWQATRAREADVIYDTVRSRIEPPSVPASVAPTSGPTTGPTTVAAPPSTVPATPAATVPATVAPVVAPPVAPGGGPIVALGDSVMLGAAPQLLERFGPGTLVDAQVGRTLWPIIGIVDALRAQGRLGERVVMHLGDNGGVDAALIARTMASLGDVDRVVWVTVKVPRSWEAPVNGILAAEVPKYPNARLLDWKGLATDPSLFYEDGIHLRPAGAQVYAELVEAALAQP
jgi:hypothetical protein